MCFAYQICLGGVLFGRVSFGMVFIVIYIQENNIKFKKEVQLGVYLFPADNVMHAYRILSVYSVSKSGRKLNKNSCFGL